MSTLLFSTASLAVSGDSPQGIGLVADGLLEVADVMSDFVKSACFIVGGSFLFASIIKYTQYKTNPLAVPLSTVVMVFVMGVVLVCLPLVVYYTYHHPAESKAPASETSQPSQPAR